MIAAIVLSAGNSSRMGSPKAMLKLNGATFVETILEKCSSLRLSPCIVVVGNDADKILSSIVLHGATAVTNLDVDLGPIGSLAAGIRSINQTVDGVLAWPVDQPHVLSSTVSTLVEQFLAKKPAIAIPSYENRGGHPAIFSRGVFEEILRVATRLESLKVVVRADDRRVLRVPVRDAAVIEDIDTPESYQDLLSRAR